MDKIDINNLKGKCLVAMPSMEGVFADSLVFICAHNQDGAMGFIINKPYEGMTFNEFSLNLPFNNLGGRTVPVFQGGPLDKEKGFILHDSSYADAATFDAGSNIRISSSPEILQSIMEGKGPERFLIALGYSGWMPQQLESEISQNRWLVAPASEEIVFNASFEDKLSLALSALGINNSNFSLPLGHS